MPQKHLELTVHEAMREIACQGMASLAGVVTVHSSVFRGVPVAGTFVGLSCELGSVVADNFGSVKVPVISKEKRGIGLEEARLVGGVCVRKVTGDNSVVYRLKGDVVNPYNRGWLGLGMQIYHYSYSVTVSLAVAPLPAAFGTA